MVNIPTSQNPPRATLRTYGQGARPIIDGAVNLFVGIWTADPIYTNCWYRDIVLPTPTQGAGPGDVNRWHIGMWDEWPALAGTDTRSRILDSADNGYGGWIKRVLNGDPDPNPATFDINRPQTTTLAYTQRSGFAGQS